MDIKISSKTAITGLWLGVLGVALSLIGVWLYQVVTRLGTPYNFDYGECWNVWVGDWIGNGGLRHIYYPFGQEPYYQTFYTPMHYLILGVLYWVFSPSLLVGRLVPFSACLLSGLVVFLIVRKVTSSNWYGIIGGLVFLASPLTRTWSMFNHVDTLGVFFSLLGMYIFLRGDFTKKSLWAVVPFLAGVFTKQIFIIAPLSVCVYLLFSSRKLLAQFSSLMILGGVSLVGLFQWLSGGNFIDAVFVSATVFSIHWQLGVYLTGVFVGDYWGVLMLAVCAVTLAVVGKKTNKDPYVLLVIYFTLALLLAIGTCGKIGSWIGYFLETAAVGSMLIPILVWRVGRLKENKVTRSGFFVGNKTFRASISARTLVLVAIPCLVLIQLVSFPSYSSWTQPPSTIKEDYAIVLGYVSDVPDSTPILSEDSYVLNASGRDHNWEPSYFSASARNRGLDQTPILDKIDNKEFGLIILEWDLNTYYNWKPTLAGSVEWMPDNVRRYFTYGYMRATDEFVDAMLESYQLKDNLSRIWVYEPKP